MGERLSRKQTDILIEALRDVTEPMNALRKHAHASGCELGPMAHQISRDPEYIKSIARDALKILEPAHD